MVSNFCSMFNPSRGEMIQFGLYNMFQKMGWFNPTTFLPTSVGVWKTPVLGSRRQSKECASPCTLMAYPSLETSKGWGVWGGLGGLDGSEVDGSEVGWLKLTDLATWGFLMRHSETMTEKNKQQHESFFGDMVTIDVWKKSMAKYMHQSL